MTKKNINYIHPILVVDDNDNHALLTIDTLKECGVLEEIIHLTDGQKCMEFLKREGTYSLYENKPLPKLILLDIRMPIKDGIETLKEIKADYRFKKIPVIMLTTTKTDAEINTAYELGANSFITKPVDFDEFSKKIMDVQYYWLHVAENMD